MVREENHKVQETSGELKTKVINMWMYVVVARGAVIVLSYRGDCFIRLMQRESTGWWVHLGAKVEAKT